MFELGKIADITFVLAIYVGFYSLTKLLDRIRDKFKCEESKKKTPKWFLHFHFEIGSREDFASSN